MNKFNTTWLFISGLGLLVSILLAIFASLAPQTPSTWVLSGIDIGIWWMFFFTVINDRK